MIEDERQLQAALDWMAYWRQIIAEEQSWASREDARRRLMELRRQVREYRARQDETPAAPA